MKDVDILIPTLRRPETLTRALRSIFAQDRAAELISEIVVVDNSPEGSAAGVVEALRSASPAALRYVHEPHPGVATARNAAIAASQAPLVGFLDDDEEAPPNWLQTLRETHLKLGSAVTFGPVRGVAADAPPHLRDYLDRFFSREGSAESGLIDIEFGCGNSMMTRKLVFCDPTPFDTRTDLIGGEDDRLFNKLRARGETFGWAAQAWVYEYAPANRARLSYALKRAFVYGQSPCQVCLRAKRWQGLLMWMTIGAGQSAIYGAMALVYSILGRRSTSITFVDKTVRGLGKVFWFVKVRLYGLAIGSDRPSGTRLPADGVPCSPTVNG